MHASAWLLALGFLGILLFPLPWIPGVSRAKHNLVEEIRILWVQAWAPIVLAAWIGDLALSLLTAVLSFGALYIVPWEIGIGRMRHLTAAVSLLAPLVFLARQPFGPAMLLGFLAIAAAANGAFAIAQWRRWIPQRQVRLWHGMMLVFRRASLEAPNMEGLVGQSNCLGVLGAVGATAALGLALGDWRWGPVVGLALAGLILSRSRIGALALVAGLGTLALGTGAPPVAVGGLTLGGLVVGSLAVGAHPGGWMMHLWQEADRWQTFRTWLFRSDRFRAWRQAIRLTLEAPASDKRPQWQVWLGGRGTGGFELICGDQLFDRQGGRFYIAHNDYLELLIDNGFIGLACGLLLLGRVGVGLGAGLAEPGGWAGPALAAWAALAVGMFGWSPWRLASMLPITLPMLALGLAR